MSTGGGGSTWQILGWEGAANSHPDLVQDTHLWFCYLKKDSILYFVTLFMLWQLQFIPLANCCTVNVVTSLSTGVEFNDYVSWATFKKIPCLDCRRSEINTLLMSTYLSLWACQKFTFYAEVNIEHPRSFIHFPANYNLCRLKKSLERVLHV